MIRYFNELEHLQFEQPEWAQTLVEHLFKCYHQYEEILNNPPIDVDNLRKLMTRHNRESRIITRYGVNNVGKSKVIIDKIKATNMERYGCHPSATQEVRDKVKATNMELYGVENTFQSEEKKAKMRKTFQRKYGTDNPMQSTIIQEKAMRVNMERYGVKNGGGSKQAIRNRKITNLERYGVENTFQSEEKKQIIKDTMMSRYGVEQSFQLEEFRNKSKATMMERYGVENPMHSKEITDMMKNNSLNKYGYDYPLSVPEIREKINATNLKLRGVKYVFQCPKVRSKIAKSARSSKLEGRMAECLDQKGIHYQRQYLITHPEHKHISHNYDFAIFKDNKLSILVNTDGVYFHAYLGDPDGGKVRDDYDETRLHLIPEGVKYVQVVEDTFEQGLQEIFEVFDFNYKEYIEDMLQWCKLLEFPFPEYSDKILNNTFKSILSHSIDKYNSRQRYGDKIIRHFHKSLFKSNLAGCKSAYDAWHDDELLLKCIKNRFIYKDYTDPSRVMAGFTYSKIAPVPTYFNASLAKYLTTKYLNDYTSIFDPFSGFSGRMLGVVGSGKKYIGQDINKDIVNESNQIINYFGISDIASITQKDIMNDKNDTVYESLLTCSPYNLKEQWNNDNQLNLSCDEWIDICLQKYKCNKYVFVVDKTDRYKSYLTEYLNSKSHFSESSEKVIVFTLEDRNRIIDK